MTAMTTTTYALQPSIRRLRDAIDGRVIEPGDDEYEAARHVMMGGIDRRPAAIVRVASVDDVRAVVALARETGAQLAIRSGGHSSKGDSTTEGGIVLDLHDLHSIEIDAGARTAWAETGLTAAEVAQATAAHGLAIGFGDTGTVGIGGITTGGGIGYLVRKHGLTIDNVLAADVVTADGQLLRADATTNPDLFWAIRGGGGNFGVVVRFQYRLAELPEIVGGMLFLPATATTVERFVALASEAHEELSTIANVMPCPRMPMVDEAWHGKLVAVSLNLLLDRVDPETAETIMRHLEASDADMRVAQIRVMGGAMARVPVDATAFAHRRSPIMVNIAAFYTDEEDRARRLAWAHAFADAIRQEDQGAYVNFIGDEGEARVRDAYPAATYQHLAEVKRRYDPTNLFRLNQNIPPA